MPSYRLPELTQNQKAMLDGDHGLARQMAMRLLLDLAATAGAPRLVPISSAHLSGVSPLTGGLGLRLFLSRLAENPGEGVAVPTTLNAAGCDEAQFADMRIVEPDFLAHHQQIIESYARLGVNTIQSCVPYEWETIQPSIQAGAPAAWAESNAICFANSYCGMRTNRESGLSALACALTGYAPDYGLLNDNGRAPNLSVTVTATLDDPTDFSILGDWIGKQSRPGWRMAYGPIPAIFGLPDKLSHEQRKALSAAAANYGSPLLYIESEGPIPEGTYQDRLTFGQAELEARRAELAPVAQVSLVVLGCPQASIGELRSIAAHLQGRRVTSKPVTPGQPPPLWVFTSGAAKAIAERTGFADVIRESGALLLENTCPEVVPYDRAWVKHVLTNSMKAEHYIKSGLNGVPTSVMRLADCISLATGDWRIESDGPPRDSQTELQILPAAIEIHSGEPALASQPERQERPASPLELTISKGQGLPSQPDYIITGEALVTDIPITFLGYVNRNTGVIEEAGHPANGMSLAGKVAIFPRGTGSSVAPYVLLELFYRGVAPIAIINTEIDQQTAPACSLEGIPYAHGFDQDLPRAVRSGDIVEIKRRGQDVSLRVLGRR